MPAELRTLALSHFRKSLSPANTAWELYSDVSAVYPEIREICLEYAVEHWSEVRDSCALRQIEAMDAVDLPAGANGVSLELARTLAMRGRPSMKDWLQNSCVVS